MGIDAKCLYLKNNLDNEMCDGETKIEGRESGKCNPVPLDGYSWYSQEPAQSKMYMWTYEKLSPRNTSPDVLHTHNGKYLSK